MGIEFFAQDEESPSLDFLPDYLEENPKIDGKLFDVFSFKKAKSGKGYMVYTSHFICWFFKKEKVINQALEALDYYCKTGTGFQFVVQINKKAKSKFNLGIDTDRVVKYIPLENTSYRLALSNDTGDTQEEQPKENPFLIRTQSPSLLPLQNTETQNSGEPPSPSTPPGVKGRERTRVTS